MREFYVGTSARPAPFGGRGPELQALDAWLAQPDGPSRLLISAPAGRGKTSLLMMWLEGVSAPWRIAFVPISIRFDISRPDLVYEALAHQLAAIAEEEVGSPASLPGEFFKERCLELLAIIAERQIPTLLAIDGLDEAEGWAVSNTLWAAACPTLRVIASARWLGGDQAGSQDWLIRLEWNQSGSPAALLEVGPLSRSGIEEALRSLGCRVADLPGKVDILGELVRLTGGDPLLVGVYAQHLWTREKAKDRITPAELAGIEPGYAGYFRYWFEAQAGAWQSHGDQLVRDGILAVLACALAPLLHEGLEAIVSRLTRRADAYLSAANIVPLKRFLLGDGRELGYSFQHRKFTEYFRDEYFKGGQALRNAVATIVSWCADTVSRLDAEPTVVSTTPRYILDCYVAHLITLKASVEQLRRLLAQTWQSAWFHFDSGYQRYSSDIAAIASYLERASHLPDHSHYELRLHAALILSSLNSLDTQLAHHPFCKFFARGSSSLGRLEC